MEKIEVKIEKKGLDLEINKEGAEDMETAPRAYTARSGREMGLQQVYDHARRERQERYLGDGL